jgi:hypothetical protein
LEIDLVIDAGVSNIAQFINSVYPLNKKGYYDFDEENVYLFKLNSNEDTKVWNHVI